MFGCPFSFLLSYTFLSLQMQNLSSKICSLLSVVIHLIKIILITPATNAISQKSFLKLKWFLTSIRYNVDNELFLWYGLQRKVFSLISIRDHCQRSSPSEISDKPQARSETAQNVSSDLVE